MVHVAMVYTTQKMLSSNFGDADKYTDKVDSLLANMQSSGYEILGVQFASAESGNREAGFLTQITYK